MYWTNKLASLDQTSLVKVRDFPQSVLGFDLRVFTENLCVYVCQVVFILCFSLVWGRAVLGSWSEFAGVPSLPV